jgi:ubiquinone biosynthesis protein Coq4
MCVLFVLLYCLSAAVVFADSSRTGQSGVSDEQVQKLTQKMMSDDQIINLIAALQNDPEVRDILNDPAFLQAIASRDVDKLSKDPRFFKLLEKPQMQEIIKRVQ